MELLEVLRVFPAGHGHELLPIVEVARQERALRPLGRGLDGAGHARPGVAELLLLAGLDLVAVKDPNHAASWAERLILKQVTASAKPFSFSPSTRSSG